jgi:hypothetical protein
MVQLLINKCRSWIPPKSNPVVDVIQNQLVNAHLGLGRETAAHNLAYCGYQDPSKRFSRTFRCDNRYCRRCRHRPIRRFFNKLKPIIDAGGEFRLMTLGVAESNQQDWRLVKKACNLRSRLLNLAPFKKVLGALCSIEISWKGQAFFTHMHVLYIGELVNSRGKAPAQAINAWQEKNFPHTHYDDRPVGGTQQDLFSTISYLYKGFKDEQFPPEAVKSYVEATSSSILVTPRGCFRGRN